MKALRKMGAGAFVAVAQGSDPEDAAIVHLSYKHPQGQADRGAGRQGHLLRHRRAQPQALALHAQHARGHERFGGRARHPARGDSSRSCR